MKLKFIFIVFFYMGMVNAQITPYIQNVSLVKSDNEILAQHISKYASFTIDKKELIGNNLNLVVFIFFLTN